jgi:hypothetical protein
MPLPEAQQLAEAEPGDAGLLGCYTFCLEAAYEGMQAMVDEAAGASGGREAAAAAAELAEAKRDYGELLTEHAQVWCCASTGLRCSAAMGRCSWRGVTASRTAAETAALASCALNQ